MRKALAILCPGPSLAQWPDDTWNKYEYVIGVNRAVHRADCTHWVFNDADVYRQWPVTRSITIWTMRETLDEIGDIAHHEWHTYGELFPRFPQMSNGYCWLTFSATAALTVALSLNPKSIDVYGADWTDKPDWDGIKSTPHDGCRNADRWRMELPIWNNIVNNSPVKIERKQYVSI